MTEIEKRTPPPDGDPTRTSLELRVKVPFEGETVDAEELQFEILAGSPLIVQLSDGTRIEMAHEIGQVYRLCDKKKEDGTPIYLMMGGAKVTTTVSRAEIK